MQKTKFIIISFVAIILLLKNFTIRAQNYPITNYSTKDYGQKYDATNWCVVQDKFGILYFGNANGIITFDSKKWTFIPVKPSKWVVSLAIDENGIIYVGSQAEFGLLLPDQFGKLKYISISDSLPIESLDFGTIWKIHASENGIFYHSEEKIFQFINNEVHEFYPSTYFHLSFLSNNQYFVREEGIGLLKLDNKTFNLLPDGDFFADEVIIEMLDKDEDNTYIITKKIGIYVYNKHDNSIQKLSDYKDALISNSGMYAAILLKDGNIALNTLYNGIIIINEKGEIKNIINENTGLRNNKVYFIIEGLQKNIWAALENGISKIDYSSPFQIFNDENDLLGSVNAISKYHNKLYIGTTLGLFFSDKNFNFTKIEDSPNEIWSLLRIDNELIIGAKDNLYIYDGNKIQTIYPFDTYSLYYSEYFKVLFAGGNEGLIALKKIDNQWKIQKTFDDLYVDIKGIAEQKHKSTENEIEIWLGTQSDGVIQLKLNKNLEYIVDYFGTNDGLSRAKNNSWVIPFNYADTVIFGCNDGLYKFIDEEKMKKMLPDSLKNNPDYYRGLFDYQIINKDTLTKFPVYNFLYEDSIILLSYDNDIILYNKDSSIIKNDFLEIEMGKINCFYIDENEYYIGSKEGLILYNHQKKRNFRDKFYTIINSVNINNDSLIFEKFYYDAGKIDIEQPDSVKYIFDYEYNSVQFNFISTYFNSEDKVLYSYILKGYENSWSAWSEQNSKEYTNLHEGNYTFKLKSKNVFEAESEIVEFSFTITAPWYRTNWAYIIYFLLLILIIFLIVRISSYQLKQKNIKLEEIVRERTAEIEAKNLELSKQKDIIQKKNDDIISSINYASKIQQALFPSIETMQQSISDFFILNKPRDIVSGDFYWVTTKNEFLIIVVADCTGHGIPGAFMSLLGIAFLNEIINEIQDFQPNMINNLLREKVITSLHQSEKSITKDGMDDAVCVIDKKNKKLSYSGAYNPLIMIRKHEVIEFKADRMPIGFHFVNDKTFTTQEIEYKENDAIYMFSDGYVDQFGGEEGKKFKIKQLKEILLEINTESMQKQKEILENTLEQWMNFPFEEKTTFNQIDDILIMGVRL